MNARLLILACPLLLAALVAPAPAAVTGEAP